MARVLIIDRAGDGILDTAMRAQDAGHTVKMFLRDYDREKRPVGKGLVDLVPDWRAWMRWCDLCLLSSNDYCMPELESWRVNHGVPILGGGLESARWEHDRAYGMQVFRRAGIPVPTYREFTSYDSAADYVRRRKQPFASKPSGNCDDKALSYVAKSADDMIFMLERWKRQGKRQGVEFILQEKIEGIEFAVGAWYGPGGFAPGWEENFEFKKLAAGDIGPNTGELGCYSSDTEVLTKDGWKYWPEVLDTDELATLINGQLSYEVPSAVVCYDVSCKMVGWKNQSIDVLVTPNHNMLVATQQSARGDEPDDYQLIPAEDCTQSQYAIKRTATWKGQDPPDEVGFAWKGWNQPTISMAPLDWARFLGVYIADGSASNSQVTIAGSHAAKAERIGAIIDRLGVSFRSYREHGFTINCARMARYLRAFGRSWEKFVPDFVRDGTPQIIEAFLDGFTIGDGHVFPNGFRAFYTSSRRLADGIQELLLKIGHVGIIKERDRSGTLSFIGERPIYSRRLAFEVYDRAVQTRGWLDRRDRYESPYVGKVYCAEVSSHTLFVRRNGKPLWCGNTVMRLVKRSKLAEKVLLPLEEQLAKIGYVGNVDVNCIVDDAGDPWPLEFTTRFGWPAWNIETALHDGDPIEFLAAVANGERISQGARRLNEIAVGAYLRFLDGRGIIGAPVFGLGTGQFSLPDHLRAVELSKGEALSQAMLLSAGDHPILAVGTGGTVRAAGRAAYKALREIHIPGSPFYRTDIGARLKKELPELQDHGFAIGLEY